MLYNHLSVQTLQRREYWVSEIRKLSGNFINDTERMFQELKNEVSRDCSQALVDHLWMCGAIPETYGHDTSEEKLYSKYTDAILALFFDYIGITCVILKERADSADVEGVTSNFSFVADAKAFRLSRTAKNQKDFKIQAMHNWKRGKPFAIVVSPIYQLPSRASQIYLQAVSHDVCILSYSHLCMMLRYADLAGRVPAIQLLHTVLKSINQLNPSKDAGSYWLTINQSILTSDSRFDKLWREEKLASLESISAAKEEALTALAREREAMMRMSREDAINELIRKTNLNNRMKIIQSVCDNGILRFC